MLATTENGFQLICGFVAIDKLLRNAVRESTRVGRALPGPGQPPMKTSPGIHV